jgi:hypothetical protein
MTSKQPSGMDITVEMDSTTFIPIAASQVRNPGNAPWHNSPSVQ